MDESPEDGAAQRGAVGQPIVARRCQPARGQTATDEVARLCRGNNPFEVTLEAAVG